MTKNVEMNHDAHDGDVNSYECKGSLQLSNLLRWCSGPISAHDTDVEPQM